MMMILERYSVIHDNLKIVLVPRQDFETDGLPLLARGGIVESDVCRTPNKAFYMCWRRGCFAMAWRSSQTVWTALRRFLHLHGFKRSHCFLHLRFSTRKVLCSGT